MESGKLKIVICRHGFVYIGKVYIDGTWVKITNPFNIHRYGTTMGLGQLALEGPQEETTMHPTGTIHTHILGVVNFIDCDESKWTEQYND